MGRRCCLYGTGSAPSEQEFPTNDKPRPGWYVVPSNNHRNDVPQTTSPNQFDEKQEEALRSIRMSRIILPVLIGIGVVGYLLWKQFDPAEFRRIEWTSHAFFWIGVAVLILIIRHLAYATRLRILTEGEFTWKKCIELIFIWEFSSAVSPTSLGGSAVAFFVLAQEKLSTAKTATIVLYTVVLDTAFFVLTLPIMFAVFGPGMIRPGMDSFADLDVWGYYFIFAYVLMATYGSIIAWGLFRNPINFKRLLVWFTKFGFLRRFRRGAIETGNEMVLASKEMTKRNWKFHLGAFLATATAWSCRFLLLNCLIVALVPSVPGDFFTQFELYARLETMFVIIAFSPTPGGAGFVEILFNGFLTDYVTNSTLSTTISTIWRILTYYSYLIAGVIIIPNWLRTILNERNRRRREREQNQNVA